MFNGVTQNILFKYRSLSPIDELYRMISKGELWFSSAKSFNDPFDTSITYFIDGIHTPLAEKWINNASLKFMPNESEEFRKNFSEQRLKQIRTDPEEINRMRKDLIDSNYENFGICSLSGTNDNLLLWAHYANKHNGICLGLNVDKIWEMAKIVAKNKDVIDLVKVDYSTDMPNINFFEAMLKDDDDFNDVLQFIKTKSIHWDYENEHRVLYYHKSEQAFSFGPELVSEVILGCRMSSEDKENVTNYCKTNSPKIKLFNAIQDQYSFKLNIIPI